MENWRIIETKFPKENLNHNETVFTIGNGYMSCRGSFEEGYPGEVATTFVHGVFNDVPTYHTELVNFPNIFSMRILMEDEVFDLSTGKIFNYFRKLELQNGLLTREITWQSPGGREATFLFERFMNMDDIHHAALRFSIRSHNFNGRLSLHFPISGIVSNERYRHWDYIAQGREGEGGCFLNLQTIDTQIRASIYEQIVFSDAGLKQGQYWDTKWTPCLVYQYPVKSGDALSGTKHSVIYTGREVESPEHAARITCCKAAEKGFDEHLKRSEKIWNDLWHRSNVTIEGDDLADRSLRYNLFQVLIAAPRHEDQVSIGAKTLSGYGYRGHVFWDTEIFLLPFFIFTQPAIAKNLLMYRYHTLPGARKKARQNGYKGAMYAWESAATGEEVTPTWVVGPEAELIKIWCGVIEQHITADVVYAVRQYWQVTGDDDFMRDFGAEIVLSAAIFYASRLEWDVEDDQYHMRDVIGPDEYHEHVDDNAMTNLMAQWVLDFGKTVGIWLRDNFPEHYQILLKNLNLNQEDLFSWSEMARQIAIIVREDGIIEQFGGYFDLIFQDQQTLEPRSESLQSLFGIEGVQAYQFIKQPDVVMALFLLKERFATEQIIENLNYYTQRTDLTQGSSLGPSIQALMLACFGDVEEAKALLIKTLLTDLDNNRGNTPDGIHAASAGAVWQVVLLGFLGFDVINGQPVLEPHLPKGWERVKLNILWRGKNLVFDIF